MESLEVKEIISRLKGAKSGIVYHLDMLISDMENKIIIGEINRPVVEKVKKIRKKRTPKVKGEAILEPEIPKIEDKPRRKRVKRLVETPAPDSVSSKGGVSKPFYDE